MVDHLFLLGSISAQNHFLLAELFVDLGHRVDLVLGEFELFEYLFDVPALYCVLISQLLKESLELGVFFLELLVVLFELLVVDMEALELN